MALNSMHASRSTRWCASLLLSVLTLVSSSVARTDERWDLAALMT